MTIDVLDSSQKPFNDGSELTAPEGAVGDSLTVAIWTTVSRFSGVLRGIAITAAVYGRDMVGERVPVITSCRTSSSMGCWPGPCIPHS